MLKKFTEGLVFGGGFGISFIALWYLFAYLIYPMFAGPQMERTINSKISEIETNIQLSPSTTSKEFQKPAIQFHEMTIEDQIKEASVIALARFEPSTDGRMKAIIKEFLKKEEGTTIYYNIGDEYPSSSYHPKENTRYGDGVIIFFTDSPARMKLSMTFYGDRISSLGDLPLELLRTKCSTDN